jgi:Sec-independent protein translocase protein TatA
VNVTISEIIVILLIALLVIKPEQLPDLAFSLGRFAYAIRRMFSKIKDEMNGYLDVIEKPDERKREP